MKFRYLIAAMILSLCTVACVQEPIGTLSEIQVSGSYVSIDVNGGARKAGGRPGRLPSG